MALVCSLPSFELPLNLARLEHLENVAFLHVLVAVEHDAALEAGRHLARVLLEAPQRADPPGPDHGAVADEPDAGATPDHAVEHVGAGDRADARGAERLAHLGAADRGLDLLRREQALH